MSGNSESSSNWPWLRDLLLLICLLALLAVIAKPNYIGGGPHEQPLPIINNLRQIQSYKTEWAIEHGYTNESQILQLTNLLTEKDLLHLMIYDSSKQNQVIWRCLLLAKFILLEESTPGRRQNSPENLNFELQLGPKGASFGWHQIRTQDFHIKSFSPMAQKRSSKFLNDLT